MNDSAVLAVVGLGYVGLPLAVAFARQFRAAGYDRSEKRVAELRQGRDRTGETSAEELRRARRVEFTTDLRALEATESTGMVFASGVFGYLQ